MGGLLLLAALMNGCTTVPYQEMSDARQAVDAAQSVVDGMPGPSAKVERAEELLERAERDLSARQYETARSMAKQAKALAIEARESAADESDE